jgi:hypothetical protein
MMAHVEPLSPQRLAATVEMCSASLLRGAAQIDPDLMRLPEAAPGPAVEQNLRAYLTDPDRTGLVVVDDDTGRVRAFAGATVVELTPDDPAYTWMPPRSVIVPASACYA